MKRLFAVLLVILMFFCVCACDTGTQTESTEDTKTELPVFEVPAEGGYIIIAKYPTPVQCKTVTSAEDMQKIVDYINDAEKTVSEDQRPAAGWYFYIRSTNGISVSVLGKSANIDGVRYDVSEDFQEGLLALYDSLDVAEEDYLKK